MSVVHPITAAPPSGRATGSGGVTVDAFPVTLESVGGKKLQDQFDEAVVEIAEAIGVAQIETNKGKIKGRVVVTINFVVDAETGAAAVTSQLSVKTPARRAVGTPALLRGGRFYVEPADDRQLTLDGREG